jgi:hypothetical protein
VNTVHFLGLVCVLLCIVWSFSFFCIDRFSFWMVGCVWEVIGFCYVLYGIVTGGGFATIGWRTQSLPLLVNMARAGSKPTNTNSTIP